MQMSGKNTGIPESRLWLIASMQTFGTSCGSRFTGLEESTTVITQLDVVS